MRWLSLVELLPSTEHEKKLGTCEHLEVFLLNDEILQLALSIIQTELHPRLS
jgi:hypothetical protein